MVNKNKGFTLIEVLIALMIFAFVAVMTSIGLRNITSSQTILSKRNKQVANLQLAMTLMQQDISQIVNRSANVNGSPQSALTANAGSIQFTTANNPNIGGALVHSDLFRVKYSLRGGGLSRDINMFVDSSPKDRAIPEVILPGVSNLQFKFINNHGQTLTYWYSQTTNSLSYTNPGAMPQAIIVDMTIKGIGNIERVFQVGGNYIATQ